MDTILLSLLISFVAGILDVVPMILKKLPKGATVSAFLQYLFVSGKCGGLGYFDRDCRTFSTIEVCSVESFIK